MESLIKTLCFVGIGVFLYYELLYKQKMPKKIVPRERYVDPVYLNKKNLECDVYPRANGSIYGEKSHLLSGFPYYDKAY